MKGTSHRLYHPTRPDRLAMVSVEPASQAGSFLVQVARGPSRAQLVDTRLFGPYVVEEAIEALRVVLEGLLSEGYVEAGAAARLEDLASERAKTRAHAALNAGWRQERHAVEALLSLASKPREDIASVVEALGRIGDPRAIPVIRSEAGRKLLSRRRAGVEALRMLGDAEGLADARNQALSRLPAPVQGVLQSLDDTDVSAAPALVAVVLAQPVADQGVVLDTLYEMGTPLSTAAACQGLLAVDLPRPRIWRYAKSVLKRAMLRLDGATVGVLLHRIELLSRQNTGSTATLKSGYDGQKRKVRVFSRRTVDYLRRSVWRWLVRVARHVPASYASVAAWLLVPYGDEDDVIPGHRVPRTGKSYVFHRILMHRSPRFVYDARRTCFRWRSSVAEAAPPGAREEAFPELWDAAPRAYLTLLSRARHGHAVQMAVEALERHPTLIEQATEDELAAMLGQRFDALVRRATEELRRRFDPDAPDFALIEALLASEHDSAKSLGLLLLRDAAHVWTRDPVRVVAFLGMKSDVGREAAARLVVAGAGSLSPAVRRDLAARVVQAVTTGESAEGAHAGFVEVARVLHAEIAALVGVETALSLLVLDSDAAAAVAEIVLASMPDPLRTLGTHAVLDLASSPRASRRRVVLSVLAKEPSPDFSVLLQLADVDWEDVRKAASRRLMQVDVSGFDLAAWMGLLDSTREEVQEAARDLLRRNLERVDTHEVLSRLAQHPSPSMRGFVVDLAVSHLRPGFVRLAKMEPLFRAVLFDVRPDRKLRARVLDFLVERGLCDGAQADLAASVLGDVVRSVTHDVRERALEGLVRLQLAYPEVTSPVHLGGAS